MKIVLIIFFGSEGNLNVLIVVPGSELEIREAINFIDLLRHFCQTNFVVFSKVIGVS